MLWVGVQKFGTLGITFLSNIILARLLSPSDYGMVGMLAIFIAISNTFIDGGLGSALIQKSAPTQRDYSTVFYWNIIFAIILYCILFICAPVIENFYDNIKGLSKILRVQGIILILNSLSTIQFNQLRKQMNFKKLANINIASALISIVVAIVLAYYGAGVWALVYQQIALSASNALIMWICCSWKPSGAMSIASIKELFSFGSFIMLSSLVNTISVNINGLLIGKFFSSSTLGYFTQAKKLEDVSSLGLLSTVEQVTYPMLVEVKDDHKKMAIVLTKFTSALMAISMPLLYALAIMAAPVIVLLYSDKWLPSAPILQILSIHGILVIMQGCSYNVIAAIGKSKILFRWSIYKRVTGISITVILLYIWGFKGLLCGIILSSAIIVISNMYLVSRYIQYPMIKQLKALLPIILLCSITFIPCIYASNMYVLENNIWFNCIIGIIYLMIYLLSIKYIPIQSIAEIRNIIRTSLKIKK